MKKTTVTVLTAILCAIFVAGIGFLFHAARILYDYEAILAAALLCVFSGTALLIILAKKL